MSKKTQGFSEDQTRVPFLIQPFLLQTNSIASSVFFFLLLFHSTLLSPKYFYLSSWVSISFLITSLSLRLIYPSEGYLGSAVCLDYFGPFCNIGQLTSILWFQFGIISMPKIQISLSLSILPHPARLSHNHHVVVLWELQPSSFLIEGFKSCFFRKENYCLKVKIQFLENKHMTFKTNVTI